MASKRKQKLATVEIRSYVDGELIRTEYIEKMLHWAVKEKKWYFNSPGGMKHFLTEQDPPILVKRVGRR